ncbi:MULTISPECIES: DUF6479 family protein [unclassified Streptomyces]|uniref:DUF6479 family protein n=1 Tax=unclassified Streptomyces TaxID=2593676 RepID=UPI002E2FD601|nr:DUF6479 family protein [Streptomyces sp. NBC_01477]
MDTALSHPAYLAGGATAGWAAGFGVLVVALILVAFWWGSRRASRRPVPPQEPQAGAGSWHAPDESETHHTARSSDDGR